MPQDYRASIQRRDFYKWMDTEVNPKNQKVVWITMLYYMSLKLHVMQTFH